MRYTQEEATLKYVAARFWGNVYIREGAVIREGADIGARAVIATVCAKYTGNIVPMKDTILIRIGCETHSVSQWELHGTTLAEKHNEREWWNRTGKAMLLFLISEASQYQAILRECKGGQ